MDASPVLISKPTVKDIGLVFQNVPHGAGLDLDRVVSRSEFLFVS
jgi:hypothetical protein